MKKFCIGFAIFHVAAFVFFLLFMQSQADVAQHQLYWIFWLVADFPISLLIFIAAKLGFLLLTISCSCFMASLEQFGGIFCQLFCLQLILGRFNS